MDRHIVLRFDMSVDREGERWLAKSHCLGLAAYGFTEEAAAFRLRDSIDFFVVSYIEYRGLDALRKWFDNHDVIHSVGTLQTYHPHRIAPHAEYTEQRTWVSA